MRLLQNDTPAHRASDRYLGTKRRQNNGLPLPRGLFPSMDAAFALRQYRSSQHVESLSLKRKERKEESGRDRVSGEG